MAKEDTNAVISLNRKAWEVKSHDLQLSKKYAEESIQIAHRLNYIRGLSFSYSILGNYFKQKARYDSSMLYYRKSLTIREKLRDTLNIARAYRNIMAIEKLQGNSKKAIETGQLGLRLLEKKRPDAEMQKEKAWMMNSLGAVYFNKGDLIHALPLIRDGKNLFIQQEDEGGLAAACINLGYIYDEQKIHSKALEEYNMAVPLLIRSNNQEELAKVYINIGKVYYDTGKLSDALIYYKNSLKIRKEIGFTKDLPGSLMNMGVVYDDLKMSDSAILYYRKALDLSRRSSDTIVQYESSRALGNILYDAQDYRSSLRHLLYAANLTDNVAHTVENNVLFNELSKTYSALGNADSALFYSNRYSKVNDSLNKVYQESLILNAAINETDYKYQLSQENARRQQAAIIGMTAALILIIIIFFLYVRFVQSKKSMQALKEQVKDKELKALDAMLEGQQEERKRLATELHDTIGSMLSATKYSFKAMEKSMEKMVEENKNQYQKINSMLDDTMDSVRRISHNMASGIFAEKGMEGALRELCLTFEQDDKMRIHLNVHGFDQSLEYNMEVNIYRIIQELLTNIIKHAHASEVTIQLIKSSENINLTVEDDGRGFDAAEARRKKGMGLSNIDLRVKKLLGRWNIDSGKGKGATVIIDIPVTKTA